MVFVSPLAIEIKKMEMSCSHHYAMAKPLRQSLSNYKGAEAFTSEKLKVTIKKGLFHNWQLIQNFCITPNCLIVNYSKRWCCNFKELSQDGERVVFC